MKGTWFIGAALAGAVVAGTFALRTNASENNSQLFTPARYSLVAAEIDAGMLQNGDFGGAGNRRRVLFKLDSVTGDVWVLQLSIIGGNNPQVTGADWYRVGRQNAGTADNGGAQPPTGM